MEGNGYSVKEYIESMEKRLARRLDDIIDQTRQTNERVSELERWRAYLFGAAALAIALGIPDIVRILTK